MILIKKLQEKKSPLIKWSLLILGLFFLLSWISTCNKRNQALKDLAAAKQEVKYWKDESGNAHATIKKVMYEKEQMKSEVDSIAKVLKIKPKKIIQYVQATAKIDTIIKPEYTTVVIKDTIKIGDTTRVDSTIGYKLDYRDSVFLSIKGVVPSKEGLQVKAQATLSVTDYWKRKWFLGKKKYYFDIGTDNPYITFTNAKSLTLRPPPKLRIRPGIGVGINYNQTTHKLSPGFQFGIYLFRSR